MINIAPLLTPSQPTAQPTTTAVNSQGSESIFGKILGQKITDHRSPEGKLPSTQKALSKKESPAASEQQTPSSDTAENAPFVENDIAATEDTSAVSTSKEDQQFDEPVAIEVEKPFPEIIIAQLINNSSAINPSFTASDTGENNVSKNNITNEPEYSAQPRIEPQDAISMKSSANILNEDEGTLTAKPDNSSTAATPSHDASSEKQDHKIFSPNSPGVNWASNQAIAADKHSHPKLFADSKVAPAGTTPADASEEGHPLPANVERIEQSVPLSQSPNTRPTHILQNKETSKDSSGANTVMHSSVITSDKTALATETSPSPAQSLWPDNTSLAGNVTVTISGYFAAAKIQQSSQPVKDDTMFTNNGPVIETDSANRIEQKTAPTLTLGLRHLAIIAEQTPVTMAAVSPVAQHIPQQMTADTQAPLMVSLNQLTALKSPAMETQEKPRPLTVEPLRQQFHEQQLQIKSETQNNEGNDQRSTSKQETATTTLTQSFQNSSTNSTEHPLSFSELSQAMMASTQSHTTHAAPQPISPTAQLSPVVHDNVVLQQVAERFQMQMQNQETKLRIQLQPAELGKLDINLTVKEGSIRAHVVAQSGQVQELLERNMTKLKGILENQGFSIEEIIVSTASESISNSDLFHDQATRHQNPAGTKSHFSDTPFSDTLDSIVTSGAEPATSVNITA